MPSGRIVYATTGKTLPRDPGDPVPPVAASGEIARATSAELFVTDSAGPPQILFDPLHPDVQPPARATTGSAGYDLAAYLKGGAARVASAAGVELRAAAEVAGEWLVELAPGERALIPLGFRARLPHGYEAQVRPRSGASFRKGLEIPNAPGTIDADFPDEWMVIVRNGTAAPMRIVHGERIAQAVLARYEVLPWSGGAVRASTDRAGGFGSTG